MQQEEARWVARSIAGQDASEGANRCISWCLGAEEQGEERK